MNEMMWKSRLFPGFHTHSLISHSLVITLPGDTNGWVRESSLLSHPQVSLGQVIPGKDVVATVASWFSSSATGYPSSFLCHSSSFIQHSISNSQRELLWLEIDCWLPKLLPSSSSLEMVQLGRDELRILGLVNFCKPRMRNCHESISKSSPNQMEKEIENGFGGGLKRCPKGEE